MDRLGKFGNWKNTNGASYEMSSSINCAIVIPIVTFLALDVEGSLQSRAIEGT